MTAPFSREKVKELMSNFIYDVANFVVKENGEVYFLIKRKIRDVEGNYIKDCVEIIQPIGKYYFDLGELDYDMA